MSRKIASKVVIEDLKPIKGTKVATVKGWKKYHVKDWFSVIQHIRFPLRRSSTLFC